MTHGALFALGPEVGPDAATSTTDCRKFAGVWCQN